MKGHLSRFWPGDCLWFLLSCLALSAPNFGFARALTLEQCLSSARDNYPSIRQYELVEKSSSLTLSNVARTWLPRMEIVGFASVFNDPLDIAPGLQPVLDDAGQTFYGAAVKLNQILYDGGEIKAQRKVAKAQADVSSNRISVEMHSVDDKVEDLFFGILLMREQIGQLKLLTEDLRISESTVSSLQKRGVASQSDLDRVHVMQVQTEQQMTDLQTTYRTYCNVLGIFIGCELNDSTVFEKPSEMPSDNTIRPEMNLFRAEDALLERRQSLLDSRLIPKVGLFGVASVHNSPLPMMQDSYLIGGISVNWNIGSLYTRKNDLLMLETQRMQNDVRRETFLFDNRLEHQEANGQIENYRRQIELDERVVSLREDIMEKTERKVEAGTETVNEMLSDINAVSEAKQQKAIHEILLLREIYKNNVNMAQ